MKAGIIAAGTGSRFFEAGWNEPKPLIPVNGKPLIAYVLTNLFQAGVKKIDILLNEETRFDPVEAYLTKLPEAARIQVWRKTTRSSYESFRYVMDRLNQPPFLISTVDTIMDHVELGDYLCLDSYPSDCGLVLAVTDFVYDENPLWVELSEAGKITCIGDSVTHKQYVTAGAYLVLKEMKESAPAQNFPALRYFLQDLMKGPDTVWGKKFQMALDIDRPEDIRVAESLLVHH